MPGQLVQCRVVAVGIAGDRVGDGPVHGGEGGEFLAGQVADSHDQVVVMPDVADVARAQPGQRQLVALRGVDRAGVDRRSRAGAG